MVLSFRVFSFFDYYHGMKEISIYRNCTLVLDFLIYPRLAAYSNTFSSNMSGNTKSQCLVSDEILKVCN